MIRNYIKVAIRSMFRNKVFTFINVFGLAVSMSVCLVLILMVGDQMSFDKYNSKADRIYRINFQELDNDGFFNQMATSAPMIGTSLAENYSGIEKVAQLRRGFGNDWIDIDNDANIPLGGFFATPEVLEVFEYELEYGDAATALNEPNTVVITKAASKKLFTEGNPVGKMVTVGDLGDYMVTGVLKKTDQKSHIKFEALASMSTVKGLVADSTFSSGQDSWDNMWSGWNYVLLEEGKSISDVEDHLAEINAGQYSDDEERNYKLYLQGLLEINPGPLLGNQIGPGIPNFFVYFLAGLCFIIMLSACFNYTNLSVARALNRAREVGIRKVSGAYKSQIFGQFLSEAILVALVALVGAFGILLLLQPGFENLKFAQMLQWELSFDTTIIVACVAFALIVGVMAGLFPALLLSSFKPISVLKDFSGVKLFSKVGMRKALIVGQFGLSLFLIISVRLVGNQLEMMMSADHGYNPDGIQNVMLHNTDYKVLQSELASMSSVASISAASHTPSMGRSNGFSVTRDLGDEELDFNYFSVDRNYLENMEIGLLAGENIPEGADGNNERFILINESGVEVLGFDGPMDAVGQTIYSDDSVALQIIGVVPDYNHEPMVAKIGPLALRYLPDNFRQLQIRYNGDKERATEQIEAVWARVNPDLKIDHKPIREEIDMMYEFMFSDLIEIVSIISILAISIAALGLLGMAIFTAETRMKEVSIRKVLGAETASIVMSLSKSYFVLLAVAVLIGVPLAYFFNDFWLSQLAYRVNVTVGVVSFGVGIMLLLGILMVVSQTVKAASTNPVDSLRGE